MQFAFNTCGWFFNVEEDPFVRSTSRINLGISIDSWAIFLIPSHRMLSLQQYITEFCEFIGVSVASPFAAPRDSLFSTRGWVVRLPLFPDVVDISF